MSRITITYGMARDARVGLDRISSMPLPLATSMKISRLMRALDGPAKDIEKERLKLVDEHAEKDPDGKVIHQGITQDGQNIVKMKSQPAYNEALDKVLEQQLVVNDVELLDPKELEYKHSCAKCGEPTKKDDMPPLILYELYPLLLVAKAKKSRNGSKKAGKKT